MNQRWTAVLTMFALTLVFTTLVSGVKLLNDERIRANQQVKLQKVVLQVLGLLPAGKVAETTILEQFAARITTARLNGRTVYTAHDPQSGQPTGYALPASGPGLWGPIEAMVAVDAEVRTVIGVQFYRHTETPGLGGRISEPWFARQFKGVSLLPSGQGGTWFSLTPPAPDKQKPQLDAISGATGTSRAVADFLNRDLQDISELKPLLKAQ